MDQEDWTVKANSKRQTVRIHGEERKILVRAANDQIVLYDCSTPVGAGIGDTERQNCCMSRRGFEARFPTVELRDDR